jgi:dihydrolipoamide dehydrogenase
LEALGVKTDRGCVTTDDLGCTNVPGVYAIGDVAGPPMLAHKAEHEGVIVVESIAGKRVHPIDKRKIAGCAYCNPQIASVGLTEDQAVKLVGREHLLVGRARYTDVARGDAMMESEGFTKAIVHRKTGKILGYHIIGPQASILIQEVVNAMALDGNLWNVAKGIHIHPALSEVVLKPFGKLKEIG